MSEPIVTVSEGTLKGILGKNVCGSTIYKFLGVPYGKPPVGELRFKAPQPIDPWEGIKDASKDGDACIQRDIIHENNLEIAGSEDCLVLNIFTKKVEPINVLRPVMVYFHGGGFVMGCNKSEIYGPEFLLTQDIVLVVVNYRLGLLGFLSLEDPSLEVPGNAGLKDQRLALKWVQRNIKHFNGDPNNVTIFGESAGAASAHFQVLSSTSKGLFHKAILQSGTALCPWALGSTNGHEIAKALNKKDISEQELLNTLMNMSAEEVFAVQENTIDLLIKGKQRPFVPVIEKPNPTAFITTHPIELISHGHYNQVPLFIGYTSHEGLLRECITKINSDLIKSFGYKSAIPWFMNATEEQIRKIEELMSKIYPQIEEPRTKDMLMMDSVILSEVVATIKHHLKTSEHAIYVYRVSAETSRNFLKYIKNMTDATGTCHADELGYLFNIQALPKLEQNTLEILTVRRFVKLWTNFATFGNPTPTNDLGVTLPKVKNENSITLLDIGKELVIYDDLPEKQRMDIWKEIFQQSKNTFNYL